MEVRSKLEGTTYWIGGVLVEYGRSVTVGEELQGKVKEAQKKGLFAFEIEETPVNSQQDTEDKEDTKGSQGEIQKTKKPLGRMTKPEVIAELEAQGIEHNPEDKVADLRKLLGE